MLFNRKLTISNFTSSISSLSSSSSSSSSPIIQNPLFRVFLQRASISSLKVVWRKDPKLDQAILNDRKWRLCTRVAREVLNEPNHSIPLRYLEKRRSRLKLNVKAKTFISQNPTLFETYLDRIKPKTELVSYVRPSDRLRRFMEEEKRVYELNEMLIVEKLCKLLMMSTDQVISNDKLVHVKREFGFPNDFLTNLVPRYPNYFRIVGRIEEEGKSWLELVSSEPEFAESVIMKRAVEEEKLTGIRVRPAFNWQLPPGFLIKKEMREWIRDWMEMPYISPYEDASNFDLASPEMEKRMVGVLHELLSMSLFKRIPVPILGKFGEEFRFSNQFANVFTRHSGIFYMSLKGGIKTAMLREAYKGEILIDRDPLLEIKDKFVELLDDGWRLRAEKMKLQREAAKKDMELMNSRNRDLELNKSDIEELENGEL